MISARLSPGSSTRPPQGVDTAEIVRHIAERNHYVLVAQRHRRARRRVAAASIGAAVSISVGPVAFRPGGSPAEREGLKQYDPAAVAAVPGSLSDRIDEVATAMEVRITCQVLHAYVVADRPMVTAATDQALRDSENRSPTYVTPTGARRSTIAEFTDFARARLATASSTGSVGPAADFVRTECDPAQDYDQAILRPLQACLELVLDLDTYRTIEPKIRRVLKAPDLDAEGREE